MLQGSRAEVMLAARPAPGLPGGAMWGSLNGYDDNGYGTDSALPNRANRRLDVGPGYAVGPTGGGLFAAAVGGLASQNQR